MELNKVYLGDSLEVIKTLPDESVNCVVTSPPYYGLRDYGTATWVGGDPNCKHYRPGKSTELTATGHKRIAESGHAVGDAIYKHVCPLCGAVRVDKQLGLEETPEEYIEKLVELFREVRRVLKKNGTLWVNLGDSYAGGGKGAARYPEGVNGTKQATNKGMIGKDATRIRIADGYKPKDLIGIPWLFAFAMRADGWYLRQDIIWSKPNPMPESVTDRCTKAHEYIFLLSKSRDYYFDYEAIQEEAVTQVDPRIGKRAEYNGLRKGQEGTGNRAFVSLKTRPQEDGAQRVVRNKRDVWNITVKPNDEAHFATFPEMLVRPCILAGCPEGGVVLDVFMGSGTTGIVARKLNRNYIGIELNPEFQKMATRRINELGENLFNY